MSKIPPLKVTMSTPKIAGQEVLERINFLNSIARTAANQEQLIPLAQYFGSEAILTAQRSKIRTKPKRILCKKCNVPLESEYTSTVSIGPKFIVYKCKICRKIKKDYISGEKEKRTEHTVKNYQIGKGKTVEIQ